MDARRPNLGRKRHPQSNTGGLTTNELLMQPNIDYICYRNIYLIWENLLLKRRTTPAEPVVLSGRKWKFWTIRILNIEEVGFCARGVIVFLITNLKILRMVGQKMIT